MPNNKNFIELNNIYKTYLSNGANALNGADFSLRKGEIHALLGENGAGKSSLMHILAGFIKPESGIITINNIKQHFNNSSDALKKRIGMVRQKPELIKGLRVWEECVLGAEPHFGPFIAKQSARKKVLSISESWDFDLNIDEKTQNLDIADMQKTAILSLLLKDVECLIFDETTAVLNSSETEKIYSLLKKLKTQGLGLVLISHKLEEVLGIADRITVLYKGKTAAVLNSKDCTNEKLTALIFGTKEQTFKSDNTAYEQKALNPYTQTTLQVTNLCIEEDGLPHLKNISFKNETQICAVTGLKGSGTETLELAIAGLVKAKSGCIKINGKDISGLGINAYYSASAAYFGKGTTLPSGKTIKSHDISLSISDNILIHSHKKLSSGIFLNKKNTNKWTDSILKTAGLKNKPNQKAGTLSGGMLQRLLTARELSEDSSFVMMSEPGWGLDKARRAILHNTIKTAAHNGKFFLLFFSDIDDIFDLCNSVLVLRKGEIALQMHLSTTQNPQEREQLKQHIYNAMFHHQSPDRLQETQQGQ
ncbi:MAG: ATP-binding cassette domain-containing protein [Spirochaetaceae bacterium]|jgi:simple sugar transport system ATP-binding protein|nr:ATP-binding cassette domain-containing protein [Spirochaetaceae bacterium]